MGRLFGTDGVRGIANKELTPELAFNLGRAAAKVLSKFHKKPLFVIGKDTRISGDMLEAAVIAGLCSSGADVIKAGIVPTPAVAYLTRHFKADSGVVVSASHNPMEYNGIKFFDSRGYKLPDELEDEIEGIINGADFKENLPSGAEVGRVIEEDGISLYVNYVTSLFEANYFKDFKIALDCANGAAFKAAPLVFEKLGAKVSVINNEPDGCNINVKCGSTHPEALSEFIKGKEFDIGFTFDGDADRLIAVDENGEVVDGDHIMAIWGVCLKEKGKLFKDTVVATIMSNMGLEVALKKMGIKMVRTKVGDRYVMEEILKNGYNFGGEQSGHIIFLDHNTTGDGIITAVNLLAVLKEKNKKLSELKNIMQVFPQVLINVKVRSKDGFETNTEIKKEIERAERELGENGRIVVRPSGTEPLIRVMVEGERKDTIENIAKRVAEVIQKALS
ncbi:phosphoglucosamine mutase [Thermovenabulum sp.]|uniref:phosphoglucosamine mutase n=1 Tax=Thermovenabulum sp. TaxID=3100335 RepID=UPI003C7E055B